MRVTIEMISNGWIVEYEQDYGHGLNPVQVGFASEDGPSASDFADLLWCIKDLIGPSDSRYDGERVTIRLEPGDKWINDGGAGDGGGHVA